MKKIFKVLTLLVFVTAFTACEGELIAPESETPTELSDPGDGDDGGSNGGQGENDPNNN